MRTRDVLIGGVALGLLVVALAGPAKAQYVVAPAPVVSYYVPPTVAVPVSYYAPAPVVSYYSPAPVVSYYSPAPVVSYYAAPVAYPATVHRGLFGRTIVRTPFYKVKY